MMTDIDREERRKKRAPVIAFILFGMLVVAALVQLLQPGWQWGPVAVGTVDVTAAGVGVGIADGRGRGRAPVARAGRGVPADASPSGLPVAGGGGEPAGGDRACPARRGGPQLP